MSEIGVLVLSDSILLRDALCALLIPFPDLNVTGASGARQAVSIMQHQQPDVLLLDISDLAQESTPCAAGPTAPLCPHLGVIVVNCHDRCDPTAVMSVLERGIRGYLCGQEDAAEVAFAIRTIAAGDVYLCPGASGILLRSYRRRVG